MKNPVFEITEILNTIDNFPPEPARWIEDDLEQSELGMALQIMCGTIVEEKISISKAVYKRIIKVGKKIGFESCFGGDISELIK
jgi:hypothetical protein